MAPLIHGLSFDALLADKAFDCKWIIEEMDARGATICISQRPQRKVPLSIDEEMYTWRHLVENFFCDLKDIRRDGPGNGSWLERFCRQAFRSRLARHYRRRLDHTAQASVCKSC